MLDDSKLHNIPLQTFLKYRFWLDLSPQSSLQSSDIEIWFVGALKIFDL